MFFHLFPDTFSRLQWVARRPQPNLLTTLRIHLPLLWKHQQAHHVAPCQTLKRMRALGVAGKKRRFAPTVLSSMINTDGTQVNTVDAINDMWRRHFEEMEDGYTISPEQLLAKCHTSQVERQVPLPQWYEIPTLHDLERSLRQNQYGKSALFDGPPPDACHRFAHVIARAYFPLFLKQTLLVREPITLKGGILISAFKGRGAASSCHNYRALMVSSVLSKAAHRILRKDLMDTFQKQALPLQVGGLPGRAVGQGAHCLLASYPHQKYEFLGGGFKHFLFSSLLVPGEMIQFD